MAISTQTQIDFLMATDHQHSVLKTIDLNIGYKTRSQFHEIATKINLELQSGELVALIGPNGIGKSTLIRTVLGMQNALSGQVLLNGKDINAIRTNEFSQTISVVLTESIATKNLTVFELVALGRQPYTNWIGQLTSEDHKQIDSALNLTKIEHLKQKKCYELSDGQLQNVMIARAIAQDTAMIVLDEPTTHLDLHHKAYILNLLKTLSKETKKAILFSSHEVELAMQVCHKLILMTQDGVLIDTPENHIQQNNFDQLFPEDLISFDQQSKSFKVKK